LDILEEILHKSLKECENRKEKENKNKEGVKLILQKMKRKKEIY